MMNTRNTLGTKPLTGRSFLLGMTLAVAALALLSRGAASQQSAALFDLHGTVTDAETGAALVGAWVGISGSGWGSVSDDRGRFRIPDMDPGPMALTVRLLGYEQLEWEGDITEELGRLELSLIPQPLVLEGLEVVTDRFASRRNAVATTVFAYDLSDLSTTTQRTALDFVSLRTGTLRVSCAGRRGDLCLIVRGRTVEPSVYVDEMPVLSGLEYLESFAPHELHMIEVFGGGRHIRAYTPRFMERAAKQRLQPVALFF